jgi:hypothetical protein
LGGKKAEKEGKTFKQTKARYFNEKARIRRVIECRILGEINMVDAVFAPTIYSCVKQLL